MLWRRLCRRWGSQVIKQAGEGLADKRALARQLKMATAKAKAESDIDGGAKRICQGKMRPSRGWDSATLLPGHIPPKSNPVLVVISMY
jgi:hypothetical protein